ncbi:MAG: TraB/GumN family protein [Roseovarius sp.]
MSNPVGRFWKITSPDGAVSHLWGTMHSNHPLILDLPEALIDQINTARIVALELDYTTATRQQLNDQFNSVHRYVHPDEPMFSSLDLPFKLDTWIRDRFRAVGWGLDGPDLLNLPAIAEMLLSDPCNDFTSGVYPIQDFRIQMLGDIAGARIMGLEDPMRFYHRFGTGQDTQTVRAIIALYGAYLNPDVTAQDYASFFALYLQGRLGEWMAWDKAYITTLFPDGNGADWHQLSHEYLLTERNVDFVNAALPELYKGNMVIAVGAFHLPGHTGLIEMLRGAGFTVDRVVLEGEAP